MKQVLEFHGRLGSASGRLPGHGRQDLTISLHKSAHDNQPLWVEQHRGVEVDGEGGFSVILGLLNPLAPDLFDHTPRWAAVRPTGDDNRGSENHPRVPLLAAPLRLAAAFDAMAERVDSAERVLGMERGAHHHLATLEGHIAALELRVAALEEAGAASVHDSRIRSIEAQFRHLCGEDGRIEHIEDELEDLVGPDGDVIDLNERMDVIEQRLGDSPESNTTSRETFELMRVQLAALERRLDTRAPRRAPLVGPAEATGVLRAAFRVAIGADDLSPGDLVVVDPKSANGAIARSRTVNDRLVIGVYQGEPAPGPAKSGASASVMVTICGIASVRADASSRPIQVGDLLVTSTLAGHGCVVADPAPGAVLGKALAPLDAGTALLRVLLFPR